MSSEMELVVGVDGMARCIYDEALDLREIGKLQITRASHVEPDAEGYWWADMGPSGGPVLGPFRSRTEALGAERGWLLVARLLTLKTMPARKTPPGRAPCDALPSVRSRLPRRARVSVRGDGGTLSSRRRPSRRGPRSRWRVRARR